jgi:hypothetical protein
LLSFFSAGTRGRNINQAYFPQNLPFTKLIEFLSERVLIKSICFNFIYSAPKSGKPWKSSGTLNCRGTTSPGPMEAIFFGPQVSSSTKCSGGSSSRLIHARQIHREICALLLGALESLKMNLYEFCTVLPAQWATLTGSTQQVTTAETEQRMNKIIDSAKVSGSLAAC